VMMAVDAPSRRDRYVRVLDFMTKGGRGYVPGADLAGRLRQTVCGWFLLRALRHRSGAAWRSHKPEGVDA